jgi:hypothetical protein
MEIEFDDRIYQGLVAEADRLSITAEEIVRRAAAAWLIDIAESTPVTKSERETALVR